MIRCDSRKVKQGDTFIALKGINADGHKYISDAIKRGGIYMRDEMRGIHRALYFEQNIAEENETVQKIRKMIDKMYDMKMKTQGE